MATRDTSVQNATELYNKLSQADQAKINALIELAAMVLRSIGQVSNNN